MICTNVSQSHSNNKRKGSVTLLAFIVLAVITAVGLGFNYYASNSMRQIHRLQINEKAIFIGDAVISMCKKIAEKKARAGEFDEKLDTLSKDNPVKIDFSEVINDEGFLSDLFGEEGAKNFTIWANLTFHLGDAFPSQGDFKSSEKEMKGFVNLRVKYNFAYKVFKKNNSELLRSGNKHITSKFEFKRIQIQPMAVRHFNLFAQNIKRFKEENPADYLAGMFNTITVNPQGAVDSGNSWLKLSNGQEGNTSNLGTDKGANPFRSKLAYNLLGTGGDSKKNIYLNLTAGSGGAAESFHMYRGEAGSSDFYQLFTSDYKIFTSDESVEDTGLREVSKKVIKIRDEDSTKVDLTSGFPLYYLARKDYGYSSAWAKHSEFGFTVSEDSKIKANSMHLFGAGDRSASSFSMVFGNVFRRCLSLSGYKQFKNKSNSRPGVKNYEIQAGPIYYYRDFDHLHAHKLYLPEGAPFDREWRQNGAMAPIELWDQRMNWKWDKISGQKESAIRGSWIFTSGDGLLLRMVPAIQRLLDDNKSKAAKFFNATIGMAYAINNTSGRDMYGLWGELERLDPADTDKTGFVSPLIQMVYESGDNTTGSNAFAPRNGFPKLIEVKKDRFVFTEKALELSAYMRELLLMFYWTSFEAKAEFDVQDESKFREEIVGLEPLHAKILMSAAERYQNDIFQAVVDTENNSQLRKFHVFKPFKASWSDKARAFKHNVTWIETENPNENPVVPYFTLPDPWEIKLDPEKIPDADGESGPKDAVTNTFLKTALRERVTDNDLDKYPHNKREYGGEDSFKGISIKNQPVDGYEALFEKYFRRVMTDPAWILPYNHSLRFGVDRFKENFFKSESGEADSGKREDFMKREVIPEFRDAIGYHDSNLNDYMENMENEPLGPELQKKIIQIYRDKKQDDPEAAYFFASEIAQDVSKSLEELEIENLYSGRCVFKFASERLFFNRVGSSDDFSIDSINCINSNLSLDNANISGEGVIWVNGDLIIKGDLSAPNVVFVAKNVKPERSRSNRLTVGSLINRGEAAFDFSPALISGNLVVKKFGKVTGGRSSEGASLNYGSSFLKNESHALTFQPFINSWKWRAGE